MRTADLGDHLISSSLKDSHPCAFNAHEKRPLETRTECKTGMENCVKTDVTKPEAAGDSQKTGWSALGPCMPANVSEATDPAESPAVTPPIRAFEVCRNETTSGVTFSCKKIFGAIEHISTAINHMDYYQLQYNISSLHLDFWGPLDVLRYRLKDHYRDLRISQYHQMLSHARRMKFDYLVVIDFEATCDEYAANYVHEIIEFPALLVDVKQLMVRSTFHGYCKPRVNPVLTPFCTYLTGISQSQVDSSPDFTQVLKNFEQWLVKNQLDTFKFAVVTDGPWDMARFLKVQLELSGLNLPWWARQWVNIRKVYSAFYTTGPHVTIRQMLHKIGMQFQGRPHSGLDDTKNITRVVIRLLQDGCIFTYNEHFRFISADSKHLSSGPSGAASSLSLPAQNQSDNNDSSKK